MGNPLEGIVGEFPAFVFSVDDALVGAENVAFVAQDGGVLTELANGGKIGGICFFFLSEHGTSSFV